MARVDIAQSFFRSRVGKCQWSTGVRPDVQFGIEEFARFTNDVTPSAWKNIKHLVKYLKTTITYRLAFKQ
eukprot:4614130-Lingulodinium_polyedra.AAC.1